MIDKFRQRLKNKLVSHVFLETRGIRFGGYATEELLVIMCPNSYTPGSESFYRFEAFNPMPKTAEEWEALENRMVDVARMFNWVK